MFNKKKQTKKKKNMYCGTLYHLSGIDWIVRRVDLHTKERLVVLNQEANA